MSFNFGAPKPAATGFTLPTTSAPPTSSALGGAGDIKQTKPLTNLFGTPTTGTTGFSLNLAPKTSAPTLSFSLSTTTNATATPTPSFSISLATSTAAPQFSLATSTPAVPAATTSATAFTPIFGTGTSTAATSAAATTTPLKLTTTLTPASTAATSAPTLGLGGLAATTTQPAPTLSTTTTAAAPTGSALTYAQLEDSINKWTIDLEEQGKFFINQAKQLNAWDSLLISNSDKILSLNETIERVKQQQKQLDQELDFILAQQNELDELSAPLEKQLADIPVTDQNRFQTYQLAEIIDSQLKQMSEDLKEIVEHLNESNKNEDVSDPVIQISRILNAHMNSLQWIDRNTSQISTHLEQVSQMHETYKKNQMNL